MKFIFKLIALTILISVSGLIAGEMTHGEIAGIIRSSDLPCTHVLDLQQMSETSWEVECNAGKYKVNKKSDDKYSVSTVDDSQ